MTLQQSLGHPWARLIATTLLPWLVTGAVVAHERTPLGAAPPAEAARAAQVCTRGTIREIEPQDDIVARLRGKDARIFVESCLEHGPAGQTAPFDQVLILSGPDVMGGTVATTALGECVAGHKFLGLLEFIHAKEMVRLFQRHPALQSVEHLDLEVLTQLGEAGELAAGFHVGFAKAMGWGTEQDRPGSVEWLRRAADAGYDPAMLGLGMALAGPGVIEEQLVPQGEQRPRDAWTDLVEACYWMRRLADAGHEYSPLAKSVYQGEVEDRMTSAEKKSCNALLKARRK